MGWVCPIHQSCHPQTTPLLSAFLLPTFQLEKSHELGTSPLDTWFYLDHIHSSAEVPLTMEVHPKLCHPPLDSPWHPSEHCPRGLDVTSLFIDNSNIIKRAFLNTLWYISFPCVYICLISHNNESIFMSGQPSSVLMHFLRYFSPSPILNPPPIPNPL